MSEPLGAARRKLDAAVYNFEGGYYDTACEVAYEAARYAALDVLGEDDVRGHARLSASSLTTSMNMTSLGRPRMRSRA